MTPEQFQHVQDLFLQVRDLAEAERMRFLEREEGWLREEVLSLLAAATDCETFLERPDKCGATAAGRAPMVHNVPQQVGPYRIGRLLGEGGFGAVHWAEQQEPIHRVVAIKLIKPGMDSQQVLRRFQAERQTLAMMNHESIARVFDAGTTNQGCPYFVMEFVPGKPIDAFCEDNGLGIRERIGLFLRVCDAVHHAHQKGVIHRDIKPSNVLVTQAGGDIAVKVIDFGIAKALGPQFSEETVATQIGQMIGTLEYMSPEQADLSILDVDTRSDVYSLGVLLYQLFTGRTPISKEHLLKDGFFGIPRQLRETEPEPPSSIAGKDVSGVHRDLDWIVLKSLAKEPDQRYDSAREFAEDLQCFLQGKVVNAHPPTMGYRLEKLVKRHRVASVVVAAITMGVLVGIAGLIYGWSQATEGRRQLASLTYPLLLDSSWKAARTRNGPRATRLLDECLPELRGWEWYFVEQVVRSSATINLRPGTLNIADKNDLTTVRQMALAETKGHVACVTCDGRVEVRQLQDGQIVKYIQGGFRANAVAWSTDGLRLAVGTNKGELRLYQTSDWNLATTRQLGMGGIYDLDYSSDGMALAACMGGFGCVVVSSDTLEVDDAWNLDTRLGAIAWSPDGRKLAGAGFDGSLYCFELGGDKPRTWSVHHGMLQGINWLGDSDLVAATDRKIVQVSVATSNEDPKLVCEIESTISAMAVTDTESLLLCARDGAIYERKHGQEPHRLVDITLAITQCLWLEGWQQALVAVSDGRLLRMGMPPKRAGWRVNKQHSIVGAAVDAAGDRSITLDHRGDLQIRDLASGEVLNSRSVHPSGAWALGASRRQSVVASVGEDRRLHRFQMPSLEPLWIRDLAWGVRNVVVAPDGEWIAAGAPLGTSQEGAIGIWSADTGECITTLHGHQNWVMGMTVSADGTQLFSSDVDGVVYKWDTQSWSSAFSVATERSVPDVVLLDAAEAVFYVGHRDGWVTAWDQQDGARRGEWQTFGDSLSGMGLTADGRLLATCRSDDRLHVISPDTRESLAQFEIAGESIQFFASFQGGRLLNSGNGASATLELLRIEGP